MYDRCDGVSIMKRTSKKFQKEGNFIVDIRHPERKIRLGEILKGGAAGQKVEYKIADFVEGKIDRIRIVLTYIIFEQKKGKKVKHSRQTLPGYVFRLKYGGGK